VSSSDQPVDTVINTALCLRVSGQTRSDLAADVRGKGQRTYPTLRARPWRRPWPLRGGPPARGGTRCWTRRTPSSAPARRASPRRARCAGCMCALADIIFHAANVHTSCFRRWIGHWFTVTRTCTCFRIQQGDREPRRCGWGGIGRSLFRRAVPWSNATHSHSHFGDLGDALPAGQLAQVQPLELGFCCLPALADGCAKVPLREIEKEEQRSCGFRQTYFLRLCAYLTFIVGVEISQDLANKSVKCAPGLCRTAR